MSTTGIDVSRRSGQGMPCSLLARACTTYDWRRIVSTRSVAGVARARVWNIPVSAPRGLEVPKSDAHSPKSEVQTGGVAMKNPWLCRRFATALLLSALLGVLAGCGGSGSGAGSSSCVCTGSSSSSNSSSSSSSATAAGYLYVVSAADAEVPLPGTVYQFSIAQDGSLAALAEPSVATGAEPVSIVSESSGHNVYVTVANPADPGVWQYAVGAGGSLTPLAVASVSIQSSLSQQASYAAKVDPSGHFLYVVTTDSAAASIAQ